MLQIGQILQIGLDSFLMQSNRHVPNKMEVK